MLGVLSSQKELSQQVHKLMNYVIDSDGSSVQAGVKNIKSTKSRTDDAGDLRNALKKTQSKIKSMENEIKKFEAENIHQD